VAVVTKLPIALTALEVEVPAGVVAAAAVDDEATGDDPPPDAAWMVQISLVMLWTPIGVVSIESIDGLTRGVTYLRHQKLSKLSRDME
jgi:3-oxoacyl-ACP reductase-like protein